MTQSERRLFLIQALFREMPEYSSINIPTSEQEQKILLRSLLNIRMPRPVSQEFLAVQDVYLQTETAQKGITDVSSLTPIRKGIYLWQGDITTLRCDAIVNAANSRMLGCFVPCHGCIDNAIHTFAGVQLRLACAELMERQGREEETGKAKITPAFNLPCQYVLHYTYIYLRKVNPAGRTAAGLLLPRLFGACRTKRHQDHCFLLHFYGRVSLSSQSCSRNRCTDSEKLSTEHA